MSEGGSGKEDVKELINALKDAVVELKSLVLEAENPFREKSLVRKVKVKESKSENISYSEKGIEKATSGSEKTVPEPTPVLSKGSTVEESTHKTVGIPPSPVALKVTQEAGIGKEGEELVGSIEEAVKGVKGGLSFKKILKLTQLFFNINKPVLQDNLPRIIRLLELTGYVGEVEAELLRLLAGLASDSKKFKVRPEDSVIIAYMIAKTLGVEDKEFEDELLDVLYRIVIGGRGEGVGVWESQQ